MAPYSPPSAAFWKQALKDNKQSMPKPPEHEVPACPMPETGAEEHDALVKLGAKPSPAVASQRDVQVVPRKFGNHYS